MLSSLIEGTTVRMGITVCVDDTASAAPRAAEEYSSSIVAEEVSVA